MIRYLTAASLPVLAALTLVSPARAFTMDNGSGGRSEIPQFDIEEQTRNFRTPQGSRAAGSNDLKYQLPNGSSLQFGLQANPAYRSPFAPFGGGIGTSDAEYRQHFNNMLDPSRR